MPVMSDTANHIAHSSAEDDTKGRDQYELKEVEHADLSAQNVVVYADEELEPELHIRTWIALAAFFLLNYTQVVALQGPTAVVSASTLEQGLPPIPVEIIADLPRSVILHWSGSPQHSSANLGGSSPFVGSRSPRTDHFHRL